MNRKLFESSNAGLHFSPSVFGDLCDLHARVSAAAGTSGDGEAAAGSAVEWDGSLATIAANIEALGVTAADEQAVADAAAAAAAAEAEASTKKGGKAAKPKKGKKGAPAEPEPVVIKPLTALQMVERRRGAYVSMLRCAVFSPRLPAAPTTPHRCWLTHAALRATTHAATDQVPHGAGQAERCGDG